MSTNFVHLVCLFFAVFCLASLHRAHPMEVKTDVPPKDEPMNITKVHTVHGDQVLDKKRESVAPLNDSETVREPRMSVINGVAISKSGRVFPQVRGLLSETETNHSRRGANIETNNVYGNQVFNKKRENMAASNESETAHDPRMVVIENQVIRGGQVFRPGREAVSGENETLSRRGANIETNNVYGNQVFNKKRENMAALNESETVRSRRGANIETNNVHGDQIFNKKRESMFAMPETSPVRNRRMTVVTNTLFEGPFPRPSAMPSSNPSLPNPLGGPQPAQQLPLPQMVPNQTSVPSPPLPANSIPMGSAPNVNGQSPPMSAFPGFIKELTVNGNQFLSKKKR